MGISSAGLGGRNYARSLSSCTLYRLFQFCIADLNCSLVKKFPRSGSCMLVCVPCRSPFGGWFFARRFPLLMQRPTKLAMNNCLCYLHVQVPQETKYPSRIQQRKLFTDLLRNVSTARIQKQCFGRVFSLLADWCWFPCTLSSCFPSSGWFA